MTVLGSLRAGVAVVNINPMYTPAELHHQLIDSGVRVLVVLENFAHTAELALPGTMVEQVVVTRFGDLFPTAKGWLVNFALKHIKHAVPDWTMPAATSLPHALEEGANQMLHHVALGADDMAFLQYTGGTTGLPKGAVLTHGNLLVFLRLGGHNVLVPDPRDMPRFMAVLEHTPFSVITGVNTLFAALLRAPGFDRMAAARRAHMKLAVAGGMALQSEVSDRWQAHFGRPIIQGYGLTETSPMVCANPVDATGCSARLGLPVPSTDVAILDDAGQPVELGTAGEIAVRGPQVMAGYWNKPVETAKAINAEGWLLTGDIGRMGDDGYVEFVDRKKDIIVVSGMKAFPAEIEDAVRLHPGVEDAAAIGVPDARSGEAVVLYVIRKDPALDEEALRAHCESRLSAYKRPRRVEFRTELPRTPIGKVLPRQLKDEATRAAQQEGAHA